MSGLAPAPQSPGRCYYCERLTYPPGSAEQRSDIYCTATRDHLNPQFLKGIVAPELVNKTVLCCAGCNTIKGHHPAEVFIFWRKHNRSMPKKEAHKAFNAFVFSLMLAGFRASWALAVVEKKKRERDPLLPRDGRGRFTARVLRAKARQAREAAA